MATYFVRKSGSNANAGTSPGAAWLTIAKIFEAASPVTNGDVVYIGAGVYRENITMASTTPTAEVRIVGDVDGARTGDAGIIRLTGYTTSDVVAGPSVDLITLAGRDYFTFENIYFQSGNGSNCVATSTSISTNINFKKCIFLSGSAIGSTCISITSVVTAAVNWIFEDCTFISSAPSSAVISCTAATNAGGGDYDLGVHIRNCIFLSGAQQIYLNASGANTNRPGGIYVYNNLFMGNSSSALRTTSSSSGTFPCYFYNNVCHQPAATVLNAATSGQIVEDYNLFYTATPRTNVVSGVNSPPANAYGRMMDFGASFLWGFTPKHFFSPLIDSPILNFGNNSTYTTSKDQIDNPKPSGPGLFWSGANKSVGPLEYSDFARQDTSVVFSGNNSIKLQGPGTQNFFLPVTGSGAQSVSVYGRYNGNYQGSNLPVLYIKLNSGIGVAEQSGVMTGAANTWEKISLTNIIPNSNGWLNVQVRSRDSGGTGLVYFDAFEVS